MDIRKLKYFVAVAEEGSFTKAAQRLNVSQPPLSTQIRLLEEELEVPLLIRGSRRVQPTEAGASFLAEARSILMQCDAAVQLARRTHRGEIGTISIGFVGTASHHVLPTLVREYKKARPGVQVVVKDMSAIHQVKALQAGVIHVGIMRRPLRDKTLAFIPLIKERFVFAIPDNHRLARKRNVELRNLREEVVFMSPQQGWPIEFERIVGLFNRAGLNLNIRSELGQVHLMLDLVAAGLGIAIVPETAKGIRSAGIVYHPFPEAGQTLIGLTCLARGRPALLNDFILVAQRSFRGKSRRLFNT